MDSPSASAVTVLLEQQLAAPPSPALVMTATIVLPPGDPGTPPHRHSGPVFGYMLEGEMTFELEGESERVIRAGDITLHVGRMEADMGDGPLPLTRLEFLVLKELMEHAGQAVSKGQLLESVWGYAFDPGSNIVGVCVRRLRAKIGDGLIKTVRGEGYQLAVS